MDGIIVINKPKNFTSHDVVNVLRKVLNTRKIGHTGTLDPNATGVLPLLVGQATKLSKYLIEHDKTYIAKLKLGIKTATGDIEGEVLKQEDFDRAILDKENVESVLKSFLGKQKQIPPMYSAIKINGKKLYEYAREGKTVEVEPRDIELYKMNLISIVDDEIEFEVSCSKGTYIRVVCEDLAKALGTIGTMFSLKRTIVDKFKIEDSITFETLEEIKCDIESKLIKMEDVFKDLSRLNLNARKEELFLNGVMLTFEVEEGIYNIYNSENKYLGTGTVKNKLLKRDIIL